MTTKKRNTKKTAPTRAKKPAVRRIAAAQQDSDAEAFGKALGRTLADLLRPDVNSVAVSAWTAEPRTLGGMDAIVCRATEPLTATATDRQFGGNVGDAISRLLDATSYSERLTAMERERLQPILGPEDSTPGADSAAPMGSRNSIASVIHEIANRIFADNSRRNAILDRLEI